MHQDVIAEYFMTYEETIRQYESYLDAFDPQSKGILPEKWSELETWQKEFLETRVKETLNWYIKYIDESMKEQINLIIDDLCDNTVRIVGQAGTG